MKDKNSTKVVQGSPELRAQLPKAAIARLSEKYGKSWTWIYNVVSGKVAGDDNIIIDARRLSKIEAANRQKLAQII
jgi:hypothetical protein